MIQTTEVKCVYCEKIQTEDINDLTVDAGQMDGGFPHVCEFCEKEFFVEFKYVPYVKTTLF